MYLFNVLMTLFLWYILYNYSYTANYSDSYSALAGQDKVKQYAKLYENFIFCYCGCLSCCHD